MYHKCYSAGIASMAFPLWFTKSIICNLESQIVLTVYNRIHKLRHIKMWIHFKNKMSHISEYSITTPLEWSIIEKFVLYGNFKIYSQ